MRDEHRSPWRSEEQRLRRRKRSGWGIDLYRNPMRGRIAGVCAGIADYWDVAPWVVRLLFVGLFFFTGTLVLWAYVAAWLLLAKRPMADFGAGYREPRYAVSEEELESEYDELRHQRTPRRPLKYAPASAERLQRARERLDAVNERVTRLEAYLTSRKYELNRQFSKL
jgi:phage shock protein C